MRLVTDVVENAGDKEAGQDEEQVDAVAPVAVTKTMARSTPLVGSILPTKWTSRTMRMAKPRIPSNAGRCPRRSSRGLARRVGIRRVPDIAGAPGFDGGVTFACADWWVELKTKLTARR